MLGAGAYLSMCFVVGEYSVGECWGMSVLQAVKTVCQPSNKPAWQQAAEVVVAATAVAALLAQVS